MDRQALVAAIDGLTRLGYSGRGYRHVARGRDPRSATGARVHGGRWNPPDSFSVHLGTEVQTVVDEFHRLARRQALAPESFLPRELHAFDVEAQALLDLRSVEARRTVGLGARQLRGDDLTTCRQVGAGAHALGLEGIIAPSAAGGGTVLAIFLDLLRPGSLVESTELVQVWETRPLK